MINAVLVIGPWYPIMALVRTSDNRGRFIRMNSNAVAYRIDGMSGVPAGDDLIISCPKGCDTKYGIIIPRQTPGSSAESYTEILLRHLTNCCPSHRAMLTLPPKKI